MQRGKVFKYKYSTDKKNNGFSRRWVEIEETSIPPCINLIQDKEGLSLFNGTELKSCRECRYKLFEKCLYYKARWKRNF